MRRKKNSVLILIGLILYGTNYYSQGGFKKKYYLDNSLSSKSRHVIEAPNGNLIMIGLSIDTINNESISRLTVVGTDPNGNMLWRKSYGNSDFYYLDDLGSGAVYKVQDGFYHALSARDTSDNGVLLKFNFNGDTLWQKVYRPDSLEWVYAMGVNPSVDNGMLITGVFRNYGLYKGSTCMLIKTDKNGNELWRRKIAKGIPDTQQGKGIIQDSSSKKIIIVGYQYIGTSTYASTYSNILILDSLGNKILRTTFNNADGGGFGDIIQLKDKNFISCGAWLVSTSGGTNKLKGVVVKFNINGDMIWRKLYDVGSVFNYASCAKELNNGDILIVGELDTMNNYFLSSIIKVRLSKLDKSGNLIWAKYIGSATDWISSEGPYSMNPTSDKGFVVATGFHFKDQPQPFSVIKIDSTGCDTTEVYCRSLEVGLAENHVENIFNFAVYPNPASGFVNITGNVEEGKEFVVSVTDVSGRKLLETAYAGGNARHLDVSGLAGGVYFFTFMYEGRAVAVKKVVVGS